ncbi:carboxylesterase family protein [Bradyrhizobium sp. Pear77]|uniref:carboxylesterase/lipase family protein n=1 Tax=Bradyrhizobium altum TaxID=1571202 RepID=UPI001E2EC7BD|nr:carboxylesterase family protein [Bradyrhizobium altum]MCC8953507.1 carboxylesterase family protein [Bradyrhizobium altum]
MAGVDFIELETPFGRLRGVRSEGVTAFRRIPYAEAPVGSRRFEMPGAAPRWQGVRDAIVPGPIPPQNPSRLDAVMGIYDAEQSEDCLHLDIWTSHTEHDRAPVLVFIHGGAFMTGGGSLPCYDGSLLAKENGLVVVNITYRLGILGFFPHAGLGGLNLGLHDQIAALRWIAQAISAFGGDPQRVTVIGQSAGAFSIAMHFGTEHCPKLFKRAIMMSTPVGIKMRTVEQARPIVNAILDVLDVSPNEVGKLRTMPLDRIFEGLRALQKRASAKPGDIAPPFMPVLDTAFSGCDPIASIQIGSARWCDIMIGVTREEYAAFSVANPALKELSDDALETLIRSEIGDDASSMVLQLRSTRASASPRALLGDFYSDRIFTKQSFEIASIQSRFGRKAFSYSFDWQSPNPELGACHCIDLPFLFGNIDVWKVAPMISGADQQEVQDLSRLFRGSIAAFAATGDANGNGLPNWPAYAADQALVHFDRHITVSRYVS